MSETNDSGWSAPSLTIPWEADDSEPGEDERESSQRSVTSIPADTYAVPVHFPSGYPYASWWRRFTALMIDGLVLSVGWIALWFLFGGSFAAGREAYFLADVAGGAYFTILTAGHRGQTPGMRAIGIALRTKAGGGALGYRRAVIRSALMSAFAAPGMLLFAFDCLFPLWQRDRQTIHDMVAGTVAVDVRHGTASEPVANVSSSDLRARMPVAQSTHAAMETFRGTLHSAFVFLRQLPSRIWIVLGAAILGVVVLIAGISMISSAVASMHSPTKAATSYLEALSKGDVTTMLDNAGIIAPTQVSPNTNVLLSPSDIRREIASSGNAIGQISNVVVTRTQAASNTASVSLSYIADNESHDVNYSLVKSEHTSSGWAVQIAPARLDIDVPTGQQRVSLDGMALHIDGQVAHVYLFPSIATLTTPATPVWKSTSDTFDTTGQTQASNPQEVSIAAQLLPAASAAATQTVANQVTSCIASNVLAPTNCPNTDTPYSAAQGDTYSGISWTSYGDPAGNLSAIVDKTGGVSVTGSIKVAATYTDTTTGSSFFGPVSNQQTDGPTTVDFTYPLDWDGTSWVLGRVRLTPPNGQGT